MISPRTLKSLGQILAGIFYLKSLVVLVKVVFVLELDPKMIKNLILNTEFKNTVYGKLFVGS